MKHYAIVSLIIINLHLISCYTSFVLQLLVSQMALNYGYKHIISQFSTVKEKNMSHRLSFTCNQIVQI